MAARAKTTFQIECIVDRHLIFIEGLTDDVVAEMGE
jgi:hypothetical protein